MRKIRKHKILDHPFWGSILLLILASLFHIGFTLFVGLILKFYHLTIPGIIEWLQILAGLLFWWFYKSWFQGRYQSTYSLKGILLLFPMFFVVGLNILVLDKIGDIYTGILLGLAPGIFEEIVFRGLYISNALRSKKSFYTIALTSSLIFGLIHLINIVSGATVGLTITQVCYALGLGMVFAAVYIRTGSLLPGILLHSLIDISSTLSASQQETIVLVGEDIIVLPLVIMGLLFFLYGSFLLRPSKKEEILSLWKSKWI